MEPGLREIFKAPETDFKKKRLRDMSLEEVRAHFPDRDPDSLYNREGQSISNVNQMNSEIEMAMRRFAPQEREVMEERLLDALKDYAPAHVHYTFRPDDGKTLANLQGKMYAIADFFGENLHLAEDIISAANALIDRAIENNYGKMMRSHGTGPVPHGH